MVGLRGIAVQSDRRMRKLRPELVDELAESIRVQGLLHPIILRPRSRDGIGYLLVVGRHRLEAVRKLKHDNIRAEIHDGMDADAAELAEIDENLIRADLTPAERAQHIGRRKELYEEQHPETKHGATLKRGTKKAPRSQNENSAFVDDTAAKTGKGRSTVARDATRAKDCVVLDQITGTCLDQGDEIDALCKLPEKEQRILAKAAAKGKKVSAKTRFKQIKRDEREQQLGLKLLTLPIQKYGVIVEDYEWDFKVWSEEGMGRHAANHYPVSRDAHTAQEIVERTKDRIECAADDCALFAWTTVPHLAICIDVLRLRMFRYVSSWTWDKVKCGTGYWNRNRHEILLLGIRGNIPCPAPGQQWESLISIKSTEHSAKPEQFLAMIEAYFPSLPKIELNRRGALRAGWDAWGLETKEAAE
jgi:N6-adenosine-specific RNA methylase IME4